MLVRYSTSLRRLFTAVVCLAIVQSMGTLIAHENHAPLPTKGVTVAGNNVLLSVKARKALGLTTEKVSLEDVHQTVEVNAWTELPWRQQAMITSLVSGKIDQVLVPPGGEVVAGQELARVASMELEAIQLTMLQAASEVHLAKRLVEQRRVLDAGGVIAGKSVLEAETNLSQKIAELRVAEEKIRALGIDDDTVKRIRANGQPLRFVSIVSPIDGVVTHADVRVGQVVSPTDHLYHVVNSSQLWIVGEVLESDVRHLKKGQKVTARFTAYPDRQFDGVVDHVQLKMDRRRRTQRVYVAVGNEEGLLRPGMFGRVSIVVRIAEKAIVIPADAIIKSRSARYVLVERREGKYENRLLSLGLVDGERAEVLEGVFPGDKVVVTGAYLLASLLGNEHKARLSASRERKERKVDAGHRLLTLADATVELPTVGKAFAGPRIEGRVRRVLVEPSQHVQKGQVLAEVDCLTLRNVQLDLLQSCSRLRLTEKSLARIEGLSDRSITPRRRIWELQNDRETLTHQIASLRRKLAFFGVAEEHISSLEQIDLTSEDADVRLLATIPIRAPASGWIAGFNVVLGQVVHPEDQLFEIHDLSSIWAKGYVFEEFAGQISVGQRAQVTFSAFPQLEANGEVIRIAPSIDADEHVLPVWVVVGNPDRLLKEGMLARIAVLAKLDDHSNEPAANLHTIKRRR